MPCVSTAPAAIGTSRLHERAELVDDLAVAHAHRGDLHDLGSARYRLSVVSMSMAVKSRNASDASPISSSCAALNTPSTRPSDGASSGDSGVPSAVAGSVATRAVTPTCASMALSAISTPPRRGSPDRSGRRSRAVRGARRAARPRDASAGSLSSSCRSSSGDRGLTFCDSSSGNERRRATRARARAPRGCEAARARGGSAGRLASPLGSRFRHLRELARERRACCAALARARRSRADAGSAAAKNASRTIVVARVRDHAERGEHVRDDRILRQRAPVRQAARDARVEERRLELVADLVLAIEQRDLAPGRWACSRAVADDVVDEPRDLALFRVEVNARRRRTATSRSACGISRFVEDRRVELDEPAREIEDVARAAAILAQVDRTRYAEVVDETLERARVGARPGSRSTARRRRRRTRADGRARARG